MKIIEYYQTKRSLGTLSIFGDLASVLTIILIVSKLTGLIQTSWLLVISPVICFLVIVLMFWLLVIYCATYQFGGSLLQDSKKYIKSKFKVK